MKEYTYMIEVRDEGGRDITRREVTVKESNEWAANYSADCMARCMVANIVGADDYRKYPQFISEPS